MADHDAAASGTFRIGDIEVHRLGFGAMRLTGKGIWGEPEDPDEAKRVLRRVPELGIRLVDTADSYGPEVSERLIGETLAPYDRVTVATKAGLVRTGPDRWAPLGRPEYLRQSVLMSMRRLRAPRIDLWQLHRIDPRVPRDEQLGAIADMQRDGLVRHVGLSNVGVEDIEAARKRFPVVTVQNQFNLVTRKSEDVLDYCEKNGIGFIPWYPLDAGKLSGRSGALADIAKKHDASGAQIALAWMLKRSPVMLPIPGTSKVKHLEENVAAASIELSDDEFAALDREGREAWREQSAAE